MKQRGQLGPTNYDYLRDQLVLVGRNDLASMLPDHLEVYVSQSSVQNEQFFGCVASPPAPSIPANLQWMKSCPHNLVHRMFLMYLSEQLSSVDAKKLTFLMSPHQCQDQLPSFMFLEKEGGVFSLSFISYLSSCLEAIGRADLAQLLNSMKAPQALLSSLSTSQQQLNMKIGLLFHSKRQSYDFHMQVLTKFESDDDFRIQLLTPGINLSGVSDTACSRVSPETQLHR